MPDHVLIKHSNLADKAEIIQAMQEQTDPVAEAEAAKLAAEVEKLAAERERVVAETANKAVEAQYSATQTAALLAQMPQVSVMADALLLSAGYEDRDAPPIVPAAPAAAPVPAGVLPQNTRPLTPANPGRGRRQGIETQQSLGSQHSQRSIDEAAHRAASAFVPSETPEDAMTTEDTDDRGTDLPEKEDAQQAPEDRGDELPEEAIPEPEEEAAEPEAGTGKGPGVPLGRFQEINDEREAMWSS